MDVTKGFDEPVNSHPTTSGKVRETGRPSITASVSMPPTPVGRERQAREPVRVWAAECALGPAGAAADSCHICTHGTQVSSE